MADILADLKLDQESLVAAVLYRAVREEKTTLEIIAKTFGYDISHLIDGVLRMATISQLINPNHHNQRFSQSQSQLDNVRKMLVAMIDDVRIAHQPVGARFQVALDDLRTPGAGDFFGRITEEGPAPRTAGVCWSLQWAARSSRLPSRASQIVIQFKPVPHSIFAGHGANSEPNRLIIGIQPQENVRMSVMAKVPGLDRGGLRLREVPLDISMPNAFAGARRRIAYERLLLDLIEGDQTLFVRRDEVEAQWQWIDAIRQSWTDNHLEPKTYTAGSWGPSAAIALAERDGVTWHE